MQAATFSALAIGYGSGIILSLILVRRFSKKYGNSRASYISAMVFVWLAIAPAIFLATVLGGTLGGGYGEAFSESIGLGKLGIPIGLALGLITVLLLVLCMAGITGFFIGRGIHALRRQ